MIGITTIAIDSTGSMITPSHRLSQTRRYLARLIHHRWSIFLTLSLKNSKKWSAPFISIRWNSLTQNIIAQAKEGKYTLKCNHGTQKGIYCDCEDGWMSSGIHQDDPMTFHWCDTQVVDPSSFSYRPRKLSKVQEVFLVIVSHLCHNINLLRILD